MGRSDGAGSRKPDLLCQARSNAIPLDTATWQLSCLPNWPQYWRATPAECAPFLARIMHAKSFCATGTPRYQGVSHQVKVPIRTLLIRICRSTGYPADWKRYFEPDNVLI